MTWENPVTVSPGRAAKMSISTGDVLQVTVNGKSVEGPAWILPGQAENTIGVTFGYGREGSGRVGNNIGYNAYTLQDADTRYAVGGTVAKTGKHVDVADVQETQTMAEREPVRATRLSEFKKHPDFPNLEEKPLDPEDNIYHRENWPYEGYKWGMAIDLNVCTGCSACTIACQAENNIAVVGKDQVAKRPRTCIGSGWTATTPAIWISPKSITSRYLACTASRRLARWFARLRRRFTVMKA